MSNSYTLKSTARLLAAARGSSYQLALQSVSTLNLDLLLNEPSTGPADEMLNVLAVSLVATSQFDSLAHAREAALVSTLAAVVRGTHPTATEAVVAFDEEAPVVGYLDQVILAGGTVLDEQHSTPLRDETFAWVHLLCCHLGLGPGERRTVTLPPVG